LKIKEPYLLNLSIDEIKPIIAGRRIVTIDPNKDDIIYCVSPKSQEHSSTVTQNQRIDSDVIRFYKNEEKRKQRLIKKGLVNQYNPFRYKEYIRESNPETNPKHGYETFRYSNNQRKVETGQKRYKELRKLHKLNYPDIQALENDISQYSFKTLDMELYKEYLRIKLKYMQLLDAFYNNDHLIQSLNKNKNEVVHLNYKRLRFNVYINTQRSEANMINRFRLKFGEPEKVLILFGDGCPHHIKYKAPVKNKGMRDLFRRAGYPVYMFDEFRTSMLCYYCSGELGKINGVDSPRPWRNREEIDYGGIKCCDKTFHISHHKKDKQVLIEKNKCCENMKSVKIIKKEKVVLNGLKYCNNVECPAVKNNGGRNLFLNRDKNAAMNMYKIFFFHMTGTVLINYTA